MIKSMTGFGRGESSCGAFRATVEMRSVNHRFADLKFRIPPDLGSMEPQLLQRLQKRVGRGRVDVTVNVVRDSEAAGSIEINRPVVASYVRAARALREEFGLEGDVTLSAVLALPDVVRGAAVRMGPTSAEQKALLDAFDAALEAHDAMRSREGAILARDLSRRLAAVRQLSRRIARKAPAMAPRHARRLAERVKELSGREAGASLDPSRLAQEAAILAERSDITEELVRLDGYLEQIDGMLEGNEPVGKKLDFIMQEMNREANTINSKALDLAVCQAAIEIKAEVEKIREQVQNVE
jgi:uncharacterized protein (TIGR00255 family)